MFNLAATAPNPMQFTDGYLVLVCSQVGAIRSVLEASEADRALLDAAGETASIDDLWPPETTSHIRTSLKRVLRSRRSHSVELDNPADGITREFTFIVQGPDRALVMVRDLTEQTQALSRARRLAYSDDTTGLPNREYLFAELQKIIDIQRLKEGRAAMICIHIGQFDDHGYALNAMQQDELFRQLAERLNRHLRNANHDSANDYERYSVAARTDYRQFSIVLPSIESGEDAEAVVKRVVEDLELPVNVGIRTVSVRACGGVALYPQDGTDAASLYANANGAMQDARAAGSTPYRFHSGTVRLRALQRHDLEQDLKLTLDRNELTLNYLPLVDAETRRPVAMEALLRWPDSLLGSQPTRKIVRVAERTGLILPIGQWVLRRAFRQLRAWHDAGHEQLRIAVNISAQELVSDGIAERIAELLEETGTNPAHVDVELKEHMLLRQVLTDYAACRRMKDMGMRIVVDDYGVGACSLTQLAQSPVDAIKIDKTIVANLESDEPDKATCKAAIAVARELGIEIVAEGVETEFQAQFLRDQGCQYLQGFYFATPMSDSEVGGYLQKLAMDQRPDGLR